VIGVPEVVAHLQQEPDEAGNAITVFWEQQFPATRGNLYGRFS
jgi:hypothetical protein